MVVPNTYIIRRNDTLPRIAWAYTNNAERWRELIRANPQLSLRLTRTPYGWEAMPDVLFVGGTIFLPTNWPRVARVRLGPIEMPVSRRLGLGAPVANAGQNCDPGSPITNVKPYVYRADNSLFPGALAAKWTGDQKKFTELMRANYDMGQFKINDYGDCMPPKWAGAAFKIPASWPEPPPADLMSRIEPTGEPTTPGTGGPGTGTPGTVGPGGQPVGAQPVGAQPEGEGWKIPTWAWVAGGVAVGGAAIYLATHLMKRKTPSQRELEARMAAARLQPPPPALPA